jgi:MFS family permease
MGVTILHATAIVVPVLAGFILNLVGYQIPFLIACGFAVVTFFVALRLDPVRHRCAARIVTDAAQAAEVGNAG